MSVLTRRPSGGWSMGGSSFGTYGNTVANYASVFASMQEASDQTAIEDKVFAYKNGQLSYKELIDFLNLKMGGYVPGSQKEVDMKQSIQAVNDFEDAKNRELKRVNLEAKYAKNGISAKERLSIEQDLLKTYKEGTTEFSQQLQTVSAARENAAVEEKNLQMAKLQTALDKPGITPEEQVALLERAKGMFEPGSLEETQLQDSINKVQQAVLDKAKGEGAGAAKDAAGAQVSLLENQIAALQNKFDIGAVDTQTYLDTMAQLSQSQQDIAAQYPGVISSSDMGSLQARVQQIAEMKNQVAAGSAVVVKLGTKENGIQKQQIIPLSELAAYANTGYTDVNGNPLKVVTVLDENGNPVDVNIGEGGKLEQLDTVDTGKVDSSGNPVMGFSKSGKSLSFGTAYDTSTKPGAGAVSTPSPQSRFVQNGQLNASVPGISSADFSSNAISSVGSGKKSSSGSSSKSSSSSNSKSSTASTVSKIVTPIIKSAAASYGASKAYSNPSNPVIGKTVFGTDIKKGSIPGTKDYGITEKLGIGKIVNSVKNILGNLFKK